MSPTGPAYMPTTGSATFKGSAGIIIGENETLNRTETLIIGDARMTANFRDGTMTGGVTNMTAANNLTDTSADFHDVTGSITIGGRENVVGDDFDDNRTDKHNEWYADYEGTLTFDGDRYDIGGALDGVFLGNRVNMTGGKSTVKGIVGIDEDGYASINGNIEESPLTFELGAEN